MRRDVLELRRFYASPKGAAVRRMAGRKVSESWGEAAGLDLLALGYATPLLDGMAEKARRVVAAMPAGQGVEAWPSTGVGMSCLVDEQALPFANALFDRVLLVHALEESLDALALLQEVWRVLAPSGRVMIVAAARMGVWSDAEQTPFGHGRPYTRRQLEQLVREAELEPTAWSRALYVPPVDGLLRFAEVFEQVGSRLWPAISGLILLEAVKQTFAVKPKGASLRAARFRPGLLPASAPAHAAPAASEQRSVFVPGAKLVRSGPCAT